MARDLKGPWLRVADRSLFLELQPWNNENWGCSQILVAGAVVREDKKEVWTYYNALKCPNRIDEYKRFNKTSELHRLSVDPIAFGQGGGALSLAKLPLDRFVSVDADMAGQLLTKPFEWKGEELYINADAKWGEICKRNSIHSCTSALAAALTRQHLQTWRSLMRTPAALSQDSGFQRRRHPRISAIQSVLRLNGKCSTI